VVSIRQANPENRRGIAPISAVGDFSDGRERLNISMPSASSHHLLLYDQLLLRRPQSGQC
jgi:hypothetical protein